MSIADSAPRLEVNQRLPLHHYYRIADSLLRQAKVYRQEGNNLELYIILLRFTSLVTDTIPAHLEYKRSGNKEKLAALRKKAFEAITELENLKPQVQAAWKRSTSRVRPAQEENGHLLKYDREASDHSSKCAIDIYRPRDETVSRHSYFASQLSKSRSGTDANFTKVQYPSGIQLSLVDIPSLDQKWSGLSPTHDLGPASLTFPDVPLVLPQYDLARQLAPPPMAMPVQTVRAELPRQQPKPFEVADPRPGFATLDKEGGPKHLHICAQMMEEFLILARLNTQKNLETCAVLAGTLEKGMYSVTTLIIPKQEATSDSCQTVNEEELVEVQDQRDLFQLGWIHTHPSQTCFMSSIDLHTHYSYQTLLREAIAIVMAPTDEERKFGIFRLSEPGGIKTIQQCEQRGFHPHDEPDDGGSIYDHCSHVYMNPNLRFDIVDLR